MDVIMFVKRMERRIEAEPNLRVREEMRRVLKDEIKRLEGLK